jgi:fermentation-respiration switch protein FrsA (DUF1100 family)
VLSALADRAIYYPMKYPAGDWSVQRVLAAEDRWITASDNIRLHAWWVPSSASSLATVFLHGNAGNITHRAGHALAITSAGSSVLLLDYRGYGKSDGTPSEAGLYADADAAYESLTHSGYPPERIVLHGESLGCAVAVDVAVRKQCAAVILEAPFESMRRMAARVVPFVGPLLVHGFDTLRKVRRIRVPLFVMHGDQDEIVPFSQGTAVYNAAPQPKSFWRVEGGHHNDLLEAAGPDYVTRLRTFYDNAVRVR